MVMRSNPFTLGLVWIFIVSGALSLVLFGAGVARLAGDDLSEGSERQGGAVMVGVAPWFFAIALLAFFAWMAARAVLWIPTEKPVREPIERQDF